jgi:hypothetical protein
LGLLEPKLIADFATDFLQLVSQSQSTWADNYKHERPATSWFISHACLSLGTKKELRDLLTTEMIQSQLTGNPLPPIDLLPLEKLQNAGEDVDDVELEKRRLQAGEDFVTLRVEYIIYAAGFARESSDFAEHKQSPKDYEFKHFWEPDEIGSESLGFKDPPSVAVLGSGDGALQDTLRCLIKSELPHPLAIWDRLMAQTLDGKESGYSLGDSPEVHLALRRIAACDAYTTGGSTWSKEKTIFGSLDNAFRDIAKYLIASHDTTLWKALSEMLRDDVASVTLLNRYGYFSKAYALNRFLVLLIYQLMQANGGTPKFRIVAGEAEDFTVNDASPRGGELRLRLNDSAGSETTHFDLVIIRGGLDRTFGQQVGLSGRDTGRAELGRIPTPIRPVAMPQAVAVAAGATPGKRS